MCLFLPAERGLMTQKGKPDIILGNYWKDREHFADLHNAVLFGGERVILPEDLEELDSDVSHVLEHRDFVQNIKAARDVVKVSGYSRKYKAELAILGIENQEGIHYAMPLRVMEYDTYSYKKQYDENAKKYPTAEGLTGEEFISRMKRTDKFTPVITIVISYSEREWDGARTLKEMLDIPQQIDAYVNDYRMNLVEIGNHNLKLHNKDNINLFQICKILYDHKRSLAERKQSIIEYTEKNKVKGDVLTAAGAAVGKEIRVKEEGEKSMCTFFDELEKECEERGRREGKREGEIVGETRGRVEGALQKAVQVVKNSMEKLGLPLEAACELAEISVENYREYAGRI